jgi:hypothetical protein
VVTFWIALIVFVIGGIALAWLVGRSNSRLASEINLSTQLVLYAVVTVYFAYRTEGYVARGDVPAATERGVVAFLMFFIAALRALALWVALTGRADED